MVFTSILSSCMGVLVVLLVRFFTDFDSNVAFVAGAAVVVTIMGVRATVDDALESLQKDLREEEVSKGPTP